MPRLRVLVLGTRGFPGIQGGVERHCQELYPRLARLECLVTVAARRPYFPPGRRVPSWGNVRNLYLWTVRNRYLEAVMHTLLGVLLAGLVRPSILHIHGIGPSLLVPLARVFGLRIVMTHHGPDYLRAKWGRAARLVLRAGESAGLRCAQQVIAISRTIARDLSDRYPTAKVTFIPNGTVLPDLWPPGEILSRYGLQPGEYVFTACRFVPEKGLEDLISAYGRIRAPAFRLVISGDADHPDDCSRRIRELAHRTRGVVLTGFLSGRPLAEMFSNAGLFVLASYYEGLPLSALEALSYGLPVLVSDIPAHRELGLPSFRLFKAGDVEELSRRMPQLLVQGIAPQEREGIRTMLARDHDWDSIALRTLRVYDAIGSCSHRSG